MSVENDEEHRNFIEAKMIIQEFHDDPTVFIVGTAPFGKLWFDHDKIDQQYKVLTDSWYEEYGDNETQHSKKPRIINILLDEKDSMFNRYRDNIREAQEKKQLESADKIEHSELKNSQENVIVEISSQEKQDNIESPNKKVVKKNSRSKSEKVSKSKNTEDLEKCEVVTDVASPSKGKRGRPKKQQTNIKEAFEKNENN
tara:strand:- start:20 stop:616 length:597 start_codon:yes stop_codon:yes gene_type:complete